jgi:hypothetical protein
MQGFYWKCHICRQSIRKEQPVERWVNGRKFKFHKICLDKQDEQVGLLREASRILNERDTKH